MTRSPRRPTAARYSAKSGRRQHSRAPQLHRTLRLEPLEDRRLLSVFDFGDAPDPSYATLLASDGARHEVGALCLGAAIDDEPDGQPSAGADGDDLNGTPGDEDGATFGSLRVGQVGASVTVNVQNAPAGAKLDTWIDFDGDGCWGGAWERIAYGTPVVEGDNVITFDVPSWAASGATYARFRLSTIGNLAPSGPAADGEVEDYQVTIAPPVRASGVFSEEKVITTAHEDVSSVFTADVDGDGDMDVLSASLGDATIAWYENDGRGNFAEHVISADSFGVNFLYAADVDGDGDVDVLSAFGAGSKIAWYENDGHENFTAHVIFADANSAQCVCAADVDGDGDIDVLSASYGDDKIAWYENDGHERFTERTISNSADGAYHVSAADMDGDGDIDVLSDSIEDEKIAWYENDGHGAFAAHTISTTAKGACSVVVDMDGDGDADVLSAAGNYKAAWYENDGQQHFTAHVIPGVNAFFPVFAADVDGDGDADVLSGPDDMEIAWYENDGQGQFTGHIITRSWDIKTSAIAADMDGDGDLDVVSASIENDKIAWYENLAVDFGDAWRCSPTGVPYYPTLTVHNGARHSLVPGLYLGDGVDIDTDGQPTAGADGDDLSGMDDEDGVIVPGTLTAGKSFTLTVTASAAGKVDAWIDWDRDGVWELEEKIADSIDLAAGPNLITLQVPVTAHGGDTFARFRFSSVGGLGPSGPAPDGEVEDYRLTVTSADDLGPLDFEHLPRIGRPVVEPSYYFTTNREGTLTVDATYDPDAGSAVLTLYDATGRLLAQSGEGFGYERIDWPCGADEVYFVSVTGDNSGVQLRLVNLVQRSGTNVTVSASPWYDVFTLEQGLDYTVTLNGVPYHFERAAVSTIAFVQRWPHDTVVLHGTAGADRIQMDATSASLSTGTLLATVSNFQTITVIGEGGADIAIMNDSTHSDTFIASPGTATLYAIIPYQPPYLNPPHYFTNTVEQVPNIYIYARNGGNDRAYLNGGDGKDKLKSEEDVSWMYGANYYARAKFFDRVYADGKGGAGDTAIFYDTPDQDVLVAGPGAATVTTGSMVRKASSFESVTVYGASRDTATLSDSTGNDVFDGLSNKSRIAGSGYEIVARGFKTVTATATLGFDKARLYDTAFDDLYECRPGISKLTGGGTTGLAITAQGFDKVSLISTRGGFDTADLYDTPDNDILEAVGWSAKLYRNVGLPELLYEALSVERVRAHGSTGVNARKVAPLVDFALLFDGPWVP